jgi:hypothetical protein
MTKLSNPGKLARQAAWHRVHGRTVDAERLETALAAAGRCKVCGRSLRDPESVTRGIGPECWSKGLSNR